MKIIIIFFGIFIMAPSIALADICSKSNIDLRWSGGSAKFSVELADNEAKRAQGLMFRKTLGKFSGMIFVYPSEQSVNFWMRNTLIPLDILFFDSKGTLKKIHQNAQPLDLSSLFGGDGIQYVLEINGGMVAKLGINEDTEMRYTLVENEHAVWKC